MRARLKPILVSVLAIVFVWAIWNGFTRGGQDFRVFHYAGRLVLEGRWDALYTEGPDRFLYAPGFALLMSPLATIPAVPALALWLFLTLCAFGIAMRALAKRVGAVPTMFAILFSIRPLAIDLRYGQVNLLILSAAIWAMIAWFERTDDRRSRRNLFASWFAFSLAAFTKIYPLALFLFPVIAFSIPALTGAAVGVTILLLPPAFVTGVYPAWFDALARKGLPTETHNQSLPAFFARLFSGEPFYSLGMGEAIRFPFGPVAAGTTRVVWFIFSVAVLVGILKLALRKSPTTPRASLIGGLALAMCFLPAHLIWKSYFVLGIPLYAALFSEVADHEEFRKRFMVPALLAGLFLACTSGDFVGARVSAWIEAVSPFFWVHLAFVVTGYSRLFFRSERERFS